MAEKLVQIHGLKQNKVHTPGKYISYLRFSQGGDWPGDENERAKCGQVRSTFHVVPLAEGGANRNIISSLPAGHVKPQWLKRQA